MPDTGTPATVRADPYLAEFLAQVARFTAQHDIRIRYHPEIAGFEAAWTSLCPRQPPFPGFRSDGAFWLEAVDTGGPHDAGGLVATYAAYPVALAGHTLLEHIETEGWYPSAEDAWRAHGEARDLADQIGGMTMFGGGVTVRADLRGTETSRRLQSWLPIVGRYIGWLTYRSPHFVYMAKPAIKRIVETADARRVADGVEWIRRGRSHGPRRLLGWVGADEVRERARRFGSC